MVHNDKRVRLALRLLLILKFGFHAVFLPLYEGPDEPLHLARGRAALGSAHKATDIRTVDAGVVQSIRAWPCGPALKDAVACPSFGSEPASFNVFADPRTAGLAQTSENYEAHQPPLYYFLAGAVLKAGVAIGVHSPERQLLTLRLLAVVMVSAALWFPLRWSGRSNPDFELFLLLALFIPGASESLIRAANDAAVFAWAVWFLHLVESKNLNRIWLLASVCALGPLIKLTAIPVATFGALRIGQRSRARNAALVLLASCLVFPTQWIRGWSWGGTLEAASAVQLTDSAGEVALGVAKSFVTLAKTAIWLGGWTGFRAPVWVLLLVAALGALILAGTLRFNARQGAELATLISAAVAIGGIAIFAIGHRRLFGVWGAVGGWYAWGWAPWLALTFSKSLEFQEERARTKLIWGAAILLIFLNTAWFRAAVSAYG